MKLWIGNMEPGTSDDEIRAFIKKYAPNLECTNIVRHDGDGTRPGAALEFSELPFGALETVSMRLHGMVWKGRKLVCQTLIR